MRRISPTVALMRAQPMMAGRWALAMANPSQTLGSPPRMRIMAAPMRAVLK